MLPARLLPCLAVLTAMAQEPAKPEPAAPTLAEVKVKAAKTKPKTEDREYQPVTARTATKIEAPLKDIPQTVDQVPAALLKDQGARSIQDALKNVPGVGFSSGDGQRDQVTIRGFTAIGDQFVDGIRDDGLYFRDLSNVERVEVLKGPASVLYGRGSSGGMINRSTKQPDGQLLRELELTLGTLGQRRASFDLGGAAGGANYRLTGALEDSGGFRDQSFLERQALAPSFGWRFGKDTKLTVQFDYLRDKRLTDFGIPGLLSTGRPVEVPRETYYGSADARKDDTSRSEVYGTTVTFEHRFSPALSLRNATRAYDFDLDRHNTLVGAVNEAAGTVSLTHGDLRRQERGLFDQLELVQRISTGSIHHQLLYGLELGLQRKGARNFSFANAVTVTLYDPVLKPLPAFNYAVPAGDTLTHQKSLSGYVQDLVEFTPQWKALVGVRWDRFDQSTQDFKALKTLARVDTAWSPRAGLVFQPTEVQSYYLSYSRSFQPSAELLPLAVNNAAVDPERTRNWELGAKYDLFAGKAAATAALFNLERTGIKSTDPANPALLIPVGTQRTNGLELSLGGEIAEGWRVRAGYAHLDGRITGSTPGTKVSGVPIEGHRPSLTPVDSGNLWVTWDLTPGWGAGLGLNASGDRFASSSNRVRLGSYTTVDGAVYYRAHRWDLALNLKNLANRKYIVSGHGASDLLLVPGAPFSADLSLRLRL